MTSAYDQFLNGRPRIRPNRIELTRRSFVAGAAAATGAALLPASSRAATVLDEGTPFSEAWLRTEARRLAAEPYRPPGPALPGALTELTYDDHRDIRFRTDQALWRGDDLPFEVQFFHPGGLFQTPVHIFEVRDGLAREVAYGAELFDYGANELPPLPEDLGFAGFRLHYPLNRPDYLDELVVFLGASYFRALGRGHQYGLSARGLAIDTATSQGEEFPAFTAFWLKRPLPGADRAMAYALLDSPSVTGAYTFIITPGDATVMDVSVALFPRTAVERLGVAPLTSMYLFGPNDRLGIDDFRPRVHDSDGLAVWTGSGERIWRPLVNPESLRISSFTDETPRGFGLVQRERDFEAYQDLEARYELRPTAWVQPLGDWGRGRVQLIEIPTDEEIHDNIVAYWVPETPVEPGRELSFGYRLHWCTRPPQPPAGGLVVATHVGAGSVPDSRKFVIDYAGGPLDDLAPDAPVEPVVTVWHGEVHNPVAVHNDAVGGWRLFFDMTSDADRPVEMRAFLRLDDAALTETWSYQWTT